MRTLFQFLLFLSLSWSCSSYAGPNLRDEDAISSLKGVNSAALWIVGFDQDTQAIGLSENAVRNTVQPTLEQLGIKIISGKEALESTTVPVFTVNVNVARNNVDSSYSFSLEFRQKVHPLSNKNLTIHVPTWSIASQGMQNNEAVASQIIKYIHDAMQFFRQDYQRANSKP